MATPSVLRWSVTATIALTFVLLVMASIHTVESESVDHCSSKSKCRDCIRTVNCAWCMQTDIGNITRCYHKDHPTECQAIWNPQSHHENVKNEILSRKAKDLTGSTVGQGDSYVRSTEQLSSSFSSYTSTSTSTSYRKSVQVSPQRVNLQLRVGK